MHSILFSNISQRSFWLFLSLQRNVKK